MKNKTIFFTILSGLCLSSCKKDKTTIINEPYSNYEKTFGGSFNDSANDIIIRNNELYLFGTTKSFGDSNGDFYLIKTDAQGEVIYERTYGGNSEEKGISILPIRNGGFLLLGWTTSSGMGQKDILVIKINPNGDIIWESTFGGSSNDTPQDIIETSSSEFCIAATTQSFGSTSRDIYMLWIDQGGNFIRDRKYGEPGLDARSGYDVSSQLMEIENNEIMLFGTTSSFGAISRDYFLLKTNDIGDSLWSGRYGGSDYEAGAAFTRTPDHGYLLNGHSASVDPIHNMLGVRLDANGDIIWEKHFGGAAHDGGEAILVDDEGRFVFIGRSKSFSNGDREVYMVITDENGTTILEKTFGGIGNDQINEICTHDGYYYMVGESNSYGNGDNDVYLIKYNY